MVQQGGHHPEQPDPARMLDAVGDAVIATDAEGRITYWNAAAEALYGWRSDEVLGLDIVRVTPTDQTVEAAEALMRAFARGETWTGRFEVRHKDGSVFPARVSNTPLYDDDGTFVGVIGVSADITEQLAGVRARARSDQETAVATLARTALADVALDAVYDHAVELAAGVLRAPVCAVFLRSVSGDRLRVHRGHGLPKHVAGRSRPTTSPEELASELVGRELLRDGIELVEGLEVEVPGRHQPYGMMGAYTYEHRVFDEDERSFLAAMAGVLGGAIARHEVERQLRQAQKLEAVGQLAGGLAHDLNNVLTVVIGHAEMIARLQPDDPATSHGDAILEAAQRAAALSRRILTFVRPHEVRRRPTSVGTTLREMRSLLQVLLGQRIRLHLAVDAEETSVLAERDEIEQILVNLCVNARDAVGDAGRVEVRVDAIPVDPTTDEHPPASGTWVRLRVIDDGVGMDEATAARAFDPFFTTKAEGSGTGLGLATVGGVATDLGGRAFMQSRPDEGTTATVLLPRHRVQAEDETPAPVPPPRTPSGSATILLVEDQPAVRTVIRQLLGEHGYDVTDAPDAEAALDITERPDLLLTDVQLPAMSGPDLAELLGARWPGLPVVLISGLSGRPTSAGARFLPKPFRAQELLRIVRSALSGG